jgi:hypothetical protein
MKEYPVRIRETLEMTVTVEAENAAQAREIVEKRYHDSDYILDADHFKGVTFTTTPPQKERGMER